VPPIVEIDLSMYRITADAGAVAGLDSRPDLLQMDLYAFERLVRDLFESACPTGRGTRILSKSLSHCGLKPETAPTPARADRSPHMQ